MSVEAVTKGGAYTEEILTKNFVAISKEFNNVTQWQRHMEGHISELFEVTSDLYDVAADLTKRVAKPNGMKTKYKVILGVVVGVYVGRKMMTRNFEEKLEKVKREARAQYESFVSSQQSSQNVENPGRQQ